jgi:hypothetical protein
MPQALLRKILMIYYMILIEQTVVTLLETDVVTDKTRDDFLRQLYSSGE